MTAGVAADARAAPLARLTSLPGVGTASGVASAAERALATGEALPVLPPLAGLLPVTGLRRGSTVTVRGSAALLLALLAEATRNGSWAAVVGVPSLGLAAAAELGVELGRLALIPRPGAEFASVTAALLDGMAIVVVGVPVGTGAAGVNPQLARRLSARARHRGAVLLSFGAWPGAELELSCEPGAWTGLAQGRGHLRERRVVVRTRGRGAAARPMEAELLLPGPGGSATSESTVDCPVEFRLPLRALEAG